MFFWIISWFTVIVLRLPSLFEPYWYGDEGIYLTLGNAVRHGVTLYSQIHDNKPPLLYFIASIWPTVFGFRLLLLISMIASIWFFYVLANKFLNTRLARISTFIFIIISSIPFIEGTIANAEVFMLLPTILAAIYFLDNKYFISGLMFGLTFIIKVPVAVEFAIFFAWLLFFHPWKNKFFNILHLVSGFCLPLLICSLYYLKLGVIKTFLVSALFQNFGYLGSWATGTHKTSALSGGLGIRLIIFIIFNFIIYIFHYKKILNKKITFLLSWLSATFIGALLSGRPYPHYLIQLLPPLCILAMSFWIIPIIILLIFVIKKYNFYFFETISYYKNFYLEGNKPTYFNQEINTTYKIAQYIVKNTSQEDKIFVWGDEPYIYALSSRLPVGRYTVAYHISDFNAYDETISALELSPPPIIIYFAQKNRPFQKLDEFLNQNYQAKEMIGKALIFIKNKQ